MHWWFGNRLQIQNEKHLLASRRGRKFGRISTKMLLLAVLFLIYFVYFGVKMHLYGELYCHALCALDLSSTRLLKTKCCHLPPSSCMICYRFLTPLSRFVMKSWDGSILVVIFCQDGLDKKETSHCQISILKTDNLVCRDCLKSDDNYLYSYIQCLFYLHTISYCFDFLMTATDTAIGIFI